jgi:putative ABC transport system substrate-binding protein
VTPTIRSHRDSTLSGTTRRSFLIALGAGALAVPRSSSAQPPSKVARIGFLYFGSRQSSLDTGRYNAFVQGMRELGYVEGTSFIIESRFADGKTERLPALAAELIRLKVEIIVPRERPSTVPCNMPPRPFPSSAR